MRILIYGINYSPELTGIGKYTGEMSSWLADHGHEVHVVTAPPYYPNWKVSSGYSPFVWRREYIENVCVWRCPLWVPKNPGGFKRLLHLASFAMSSLPVILLQVFWRPDVVWVVEPPLFCAPAAFILARLSGGKVWLHIQDFEVDAAFNLGLLRGACLQRLVNGWERWIMSLFDRVSTISEKMHQRLLGKGVMNKKTCMLVNWVDLNDFLHLPGKSVTDYHRLLNIDVEAVVALYSGSMGVKQGLEVLAEVVSYGAIALFRHKVVFVFCGNGPGRKDLEERCMGFSNVRFIDLQPADCLADLLSFADIHLLPQRYDAADLVMPSKLAGMLASGRPVIATAEAGTQVADVVAGCGFVVPPGDAKAIIDALLTLANDRVIREDIGAKARDYAELNLGQELVLRKFEAELVELTGKS